MFRASDRESRAKLSEHPEAEGTDVFRRAAPQFAKAKLAQAAHACRRLVSGKDWLGVETPSVQGCAPESYGVATMAECLHCAIGDLVSDHIKNMPEPVDLAEVAALMAQALGEFILTAPAHMQTTMLADSLATLGHTFLDKENEDRSHRPH